MPDQRSAVQRFRFGRSNLVFFIAVAVTSCGGPSSEPTSPTPVPSTSRYPGMVGNWSGMLTVENVFGIQRIVTACDETWVVATQTEGHFAGTFQAGGTCAQSGSMNGIVSMAGDVTGLTFSIFVGSPGETSTCRRVSGDGVYTGLLNGASLMAQTAERTLCVAEGGSIRFERFFSLSMSKQPGGGR